MIPITKPFLPPLSDYQSLVEDIWQRNLLTNNGPLVQRFEREVSEYLGTEPILFTGSGTIALQIAIKALNLSGEIITTPFSYVATTSAIVWENCTPVFIDIDPDTFNMNHNCIEKAITEKTSAILATHVFGNPCNVEEIEKIARAHDLKVIYDAAHCFGSTYRGKSVFNRGDVSITSFHATKLLHTVEGGALFTSDERLYKRMRTMRNFGHAGPENFDGVGINGKNSEFHAAMGLCNLNYINDVLERRRYQVTLYKKLLQSDQIYTMKLQEGADWNHAYFPLLFKNERSMLQIRVLLEKNNIFTRRYFYPRLDSLNYTQPAELIHTERVSSSVLCLPLYHDLQDTEIERVCGLIKNEFNRKQS